MHNLPRNISDPNTAIPAPPYVGSEPAIERIGRLAPLFDPPSHIAWHIPKGSRDNV